MAEWPGFENRLGFTSYGGSNPPLSAIFLLLPGGGARLPGFGRRGTGQAASSNDGWSQRNLWVEKLCSRRRSGRCECHPDSTVWLPGAVLDADPGDATLVLFFDFKERG